MRRFKQLNIPNLQAKDLVAQFGYRMDFDGQHLRISGIVDESITDGPGIRMSIFTQGCPHACPGCHNPETHSPAGGRLIEVSEVIEKMRASKMIVGITLTGGDPLMQPAALVPIARAAHALDLNVMMYTGYLYEYLLRMASHDPDIADLLGETDILVDGPFILAKKNLELDWRGSSNQRIISLSPVGDKLFPQAHIRVADLAGEIARAR